MPVARDNNPLFVRRQPGRFSRGCQCEGWNCQGETSRLGHEHCRSRWLCLLSARGAVPGQCLRFVRYARQCRGVVLGRLCPRLLQAVTCGRPARHFGDSGPGAPGWRLVQRARKQSVGGPLASPSEHQDKLERVPPGSGPFRPLNRLRQAESNSGCHQVAKRKVRYISRTFSYCFRRPGVLPWPY